MECKVITAILFLFALGGCEESENSGKHVDATMDILDSSMDTRADAENDSYVPDIDAAFSGSVGDPCNADEDCMSTIGTDPHCLKSALIHTISVQFQNGYCTAGCTSGGGECGSGANCLKMDTTLTCMKDCTGDSECRESEGYGCWGLVGDPVSLGCMPDEAG